jgi:hypothetical protein
MDEKLQGIERGEESTFINLRRLMVNKARDKIGWKGKAIIGGSDKEVHCHGWKIASHWERGGLHTH